MALRTGQSRATARQDRSSFASRLPVSPALPLLALISIFGCGGHGVFTTEGKELAEAAANRMRGATQYDLAWQQYSAGNLTAALSSVEASLASSPEVAAGNLLHGRILLELGKLPDAAKALTIATALDPAQADAQYYLGVVRERQEDIEAALQCYKAAVAIRDESGRGRLAQAELLVDGGRLEEAKALLDDGSPSSRDHAGFRQLLGHIAMQQGQNDVAVKRFLEAVVIDPDDPVLREDLAYAQITAEQYPSAEATLRRLREQKGQGDRGDLKVVHARCLLEMGRSADARQMLVELSGSRDELEKQTAWATLVDVALVTGDMKLLFRSGTELVTSAPSRVEGYLALALWHRSNGDLDAALRNIEDAIRRCGEDEGVRAFEASLRQEALSKA